MAINGYIEVTAEKYKKRKKRTRIAKIILVILIILILITYILFSILYNGYNFTISLDKNLYYENHIIIYDSEDYKVYRKNLKPESLEYFDNITYKWLPKNLDEYSGSHNGDNYFAYSFYIENMGENVEDYYTEIIIDDVIKNVDEAVRYSVYYDGKETIYAKKTSDTGEAEKGTTAFVDDTTVMRQHVENFGPGDKHKYTVVMWLEGSDIDCTDNIIGGEIKAHMEFKSEFTD